MIIIAPSKISYMAYVQNIGKDTSLDTDDCSVTHAVVLKLLEGLENRGHHVYMDNYTSPRLFQNLRHLGFGACGTVRTNRRGVPDEIKAKLQKGEIVSKMIDDDVMALKWMDKHPVAMLTTVHDGHQTTTDQISTGWCGGGA